MSADISCGDIAKNMHHDPEFAYNVLASLAYFVDGNYNYFADRIFRHIFEEEDTDTLLMLNAIVKQFEHLKEKLDDEHD